MTVSLADLPRDSACRLDHFKPEHICALEAGITLKEAGKATAPRLVCLARGKPIQLTPEWATQRQRATRRLDAAKPEVEIAIENSEAAALFHLADVNPPAAAV